MISIRQVACYAVLAALLSGTASFAAPPLSCPIQANGLYRVRRGDTLALIALRCFGDARLRRQIAQENGLKKRSRLLVGRKLKLPPRLHRISQEKAHIVELEFWRRWLDRRAGLIVKSEGGPVYSGSPSGEKESRQELKAIQALSSPLGAHALEPKKALVLAQKVRESQPDLISVRIAEIRLLFENGRSDEGKLKAGQLVTDHPELREVPKVREWAGLGEADQQ